MRTAPPTPLAAVAAAATPVVAAALLLVAVVAQACDARLPDGPPVPSGTEPPASLAATRATEARWPPGWRLVVVADPTVEPRARVVGADPDGGRDPHAAPLVLPPGTQALAALVVAADGRVAAVAPDGHAWTLSRSDGLLLADPPWNDIGLIDPPASLPGPVLGATWSPASDALLAVAGSPGSGRRRTVVASAGLDGGPQGAVEVPLEADGPGLAALPDGQTAFVVRDRNDRPALARLAPAGSFVTLPVDARGVAAGGDVFAIVGDADVRIGTVEQLRGGVLPAQPLPLDGPAGVGAVAIAGDGSLVAVARLDDGGAPDRIDVLARGGSSWSTVGSVALGDDPESAIVAWIRVP